MPSARTPEAMIAAPPSAHADLPTGAAVDADADDADRDDADQDTPAGPALAQASLALARRFHAGATLWCVAPAWPWHAAHVAVEFVHPVVTGTRALPAVAVAGESPGDRLRLASRPGDVLAVVAAADDAAAHELLGRAAVWGLETLWIGAGERPPPPGSADHCVWVDAPVDRAPHDGRLVLRYHVLWELTHVWFEHVGLLEAPPPAAAAGAPATVGDDRSCVTCADDARPVEVVDVTGDAATVRGDRGLESVDVGLLDGPRPGDIVLVHAGVALARAEAVRGGGR